MGTINRCRQANTLAFAVLALLLFADSATAQLLGVSNLRVSVAPRATDGTSNTIATLGQASDGTVSLIVRSFDRRTGFQQGTPFIGPLGPPEAGEGTVLGEVPNVRDPANPFLVIGTTGGEIRLLPYLEQDNLTPSAPAVFGDGSVRTAAAQVKR